MNPANWLDLRNVDLDEREWQIGLNPKVEMELLLDLSSSRVAIDLSELTLSSVSIDGSSGRATVMLPDGNYDGYYDVSSGRVDLTLPAGGRHEFTIDGGSGPLRLYLPAGIEARVEVVDGGSGSFRPGDRFDKIEDRDRRDEGVWVTDGYEAGMRNSIDITLDIGSGSIRISEP